MQDLFGAKSWGNDRLNPTGDRRYVGGQEITYWPDGSAKYVGADRVERWSNGDVKWVGPHRVTEYGGRDWVGTRPVHPWK